jgi:hypothetical protein
MVAASLLGLVSLVTASAQTTSSQRTMSTRERQLRVGWQRAMSQIRLPGKGCFKATYPRLQWQAATCTTTPAYPMPPRRGPRPLIVGNGSDASPKVPSGNIIMATGSFDSVTGVTSESGPIANAGLSYPDTYTLQLNTDFFPSTVCPNTSPLCRGWEQFIFENNPSAHRAFIQYWLLKYNAPCPGGWYTFLVSSDTYCYKNNSAGAASVPNQPIGNLGQLSLIGSVSASADSVAVSDGSTMYTVPGDNAVNASTGWAIAEFNIFGDGGNNAGGGTASFNSGSTIVPRTRVIYGGTNAPICTALGFTGEKNNLSFGPSAPAVTGLGPALFATESSGGGSPSNCAAATTIGDTHLTTFGGLLYDFQASGDFLLAQTGPGFVVQARQVSGAPTWPNATINKAIAVQAGASRVAICVPGRVVVDGKPRVINDGGEFGLSDGGNVVRRGNVYFVLAPSGDSVRAEVNYGTYINVSVGLGQWPGQVRGLLANANGNGNQVAMQNGTVLTGPLSFETLYGRYGNSWRVPPSRSILSACGERVVSGNPKKPFFTNDLDRGLAARNRMICMKAGAKEGALLNACIIDVAMIGPRAAKVYATLRAPVAVWNPR